MTLRNSCIVIAAISLACVGALAQHPHANSSTVTALTLPVSVDGAITPDQIPDNLAYQHYLTAIAAHPNPLPQEEARQAAQLSALGLSDTDRHTLIMSLGSFRTQLDEIQNARANTVPGSAQFADLKTQESALVSSTVQSIRMSLSPSGAGSLDQYIKTHVKAHIRIYGVSH